MTELKDNVISDLLDGVVLDTKESLVKQIYTILWELIISIQLKPGQAMSEKEVSEVLKASKTPVREAIIKLEETGLVQVVPKSGTYVSPISLDRYIEACFTRLNLEAGAVRRAAERSNDLKSVMYLEATINRQIKALAEEDDQTFFQQDEALHQAFFDMAGVPGVWDVLKKTQSEVYRFRSLKRIYNIRRAGQIIDEHKAIVAAIRSGSADDAEAALITHIGSLESEINQISAHPEILDFIDTLNASGQRSKRAR
jgi:DNA-binding GntR family transcriptional regulator